VFRWFFLITFILGWENLSIARGNTPFDHSKIKVKTSNTKASNDLINAIKWPEAYEKFRTEEVRILLQNIDSPIFNGLNDQQKAQVILHLQDVIIQQILADKEYFKRHYLSQCSEFFMYDELVKLTKYFKTDLMQMVITNKIDKKSITSEEVKEKFKETTKMVDRKTIDEVENSYLLTRYNRFQEKVKISLDKMIADRLKEIMAFVLPKLPEIVEAVKTNKPIESINIETAPRKVQ